MPKPIHDSRRESLFVRLTKTGADGLANHPDLRLRVILTNQQAVFGAGVMLAVGLLYWLLGESRMMTLGLKWMLASLLVLPLNAFRLYHVSRWLLVLGSSAMVLDVVYHLGPQSYIQLFLFVSVLLPVIIFDRKEVVQFWLAVLTQLVCQYYVWFGNWLPPSVAIPIAPEAFRYAQIFAVLLSLLGSVLIFRMNNTLLASLLRRSLKQAELRATDLELQRQTLQIQSTEMANVNAALARATEDMRQKQAQMEAQAHTLQQNETTLTQTIQALQANQRQLEARRYVDTGMAQLADQLRWNLQQGLSGWCTAVIRFVTEYGGCDQGLCYVLATQQGQRVFRLEGRYAANPAVPLQLLADALVGVQESTIRRREFLHLKGLGQGGTARAIVSAAGELSATDLVLLPLVAEGEVLGLIELVSLKPLNDAQAEFLQRAHHALAGSLVSIQAQLRVHDLYAQSERMTAELKQREGQLHQQLTRMVETQQAMRQTQRELDKNRGELQNLNENLEQIVEARTAELQHALHQLQSTQSQLVQSEKMATLGQLIAGIAHEINTPIGAIKASSENLTDLLGPYLRRLPGLLDRLAPADKALFLDMAEILAQKQDRHMGSSEERKLRRAMGALLEQHRVPEAEDAARNLVEAGFHGDPLPFLPLLMHAEAPLIIELLYRTGQLRLNIENVGMAVDKTKKIVYALKNYAHSHVEETFIPVNLQENLDTIITLFTNKIKYTVQLELEYQPLPDIQASPDELGQVWTNLLHNALQAMNYEGRLQVRLFEEEGMAVVQVIDSGTGIPKDVLPRIFDAFYTTKKRGEGTGLGLHLSRQIIERHSGHIGAESEPGRTCFTVRLPFHAVPKPIAVPDMAQVAA